MSNLPKGIIFDLDGTLVDSARDLSGALNHVLKLAHRPEIEISRVRHLVGDGARALIIKGFSETGILPAENVIDEILQEFLVYYTENITTQTIIFPGALKLIEKLDDMNIPMGLCTNKPLKLTEKLMSEIGLSDYFAAIVGGDSFEYRKPDPRHLTSTLEMMSCAPDSAVMVGDSANDVMAAKAAGIPVVCVSFGYSKVPVQDLNPDVVIDHYDDFLNALKKIAKRR